MMRSPAIARQEPADEVAGELVNLLYRSPKNVICALISAAIIAFYVATQVEFFAVWVVFGSVCAACGFRFWCIFAYPYRGGSLPGRSEARTWAARYGAATIAQNLTMTWVIIVAYEHSLSLAAVPYGWAMATTIGSLSRTAVVLWIPIAGAVTVLVPTGIAGLLQPSLDAKVCGACALFNLYATIESARYLHSSFVSRIVAEHDASHQASHDPLTGLHNRRALDAQLAAACTTRAPVALLALDLDGFKRVNDAFGHAAGDELLRQVASRLRTIVGNAGLTVRSGGDEFFVLLHEPMRAPEMASAIVAGLSTPYTLGEQSASVGVSVGLAHGIALEVAPLIRRADEALYRAKRLGRGRYEVAA